MTTVAPPMLEKPWQQDVVFVARRLGYQVRHVPSHRPAAGARRRGAGSATGLLDLFLVRPPRSLWAEVKGSATVDRHSQLDMIELLIGCDAEVYYWKAGAISLQEVADILAPRRRPPDTGARLAALAALVPTLRARAV